MEEGRLLPARGEGWKEQAYAYPSERVLGAIVARGLVTPFESLVWERSRIERLFGMKYTIEIYLPAPQTGLWLHMCAPFLFADTLVTRCDLKAERNRKVLKVQSAFPEPRAKRAPRRPGPDRRVSATCRLAPDRGGRAGAPKREVRPVPAGLT